MKKPRYVRPSVVSLDEVAPVLGASCSFGANPATIPYCPNGSSATADCSSVGATAGANCNPAGNTASITCYVHGLTPGLCFTGGKF